MNISSTVGSIGSVWAAQPLSYAVAKAGLNMLVRRAAYLHLAS